MRPMICVCRYEKAPVSNFLHDGGCALCGGARGDSNVTDVRLTHLWAVFTLSGEKLATRQHPNHYLPSRF